MKKVGIAIGILALFIMLAFYKSIVVIQTGEVGIKSVLGKYDMNELYPGMHIVNPLTTDVITADTKVHIINYKKHPDMQANNKDVINRPLISVLDKRGLPIEVELSVQYQLVPKMAAETYAKWGNDWQLKMVNPTIRSVVRDVIGQYNAEDIPSNRSTIERQIITNIKSKIDQVSNGGVKVVAVNLRKIILPPSIMKKIQQVQQAAIKAQQMKLDILVAQRAQQKAKIEAETKRMQALIAAKTEYEKKMLQAKAVADSIKIQAKAQAEANKMLAQSVTPQLIEYKKVEVLKEQAKALESNPNIKIWIGAPKEGLTLIPMK